MLYRLRRYLAKVPSFIFRLFMATLIILPIGWMFTSAFKTDGDIFLFPPIYFPIWEHFTWIQFSTVVRLIPILVYFKNTLIFASILTISCVFLNSLAGYAFARMTFKGKSFMFTLLMASMMIPFQVIMIPLFIQINVMGMLDTFPGLIIPRMASVIGIFFMRSFFTTLPKQLEEAGRIDGLHEFGIFFRIMLPLCGPAVITQGVLTLNASWNDLLWPLLMTNSPEKRMLSNGVSFFIGQDTEMYGPAFAAGVISVIPLLLVFIFAQKYFVSSIVASGIKG
jgi:multiple sugar transport system permease protein